MQEQDRSQFAETLLAACGVYERKTIEKEVIEMYWRLLKPYSIAEFKSAMNRHLSECKWFPRPSDLIELIHTASETNPNAIWVTIISRLESGTYDLRKYNENTIRALKAIGGIKQLGRTPYNFLDQKRREFVEIYNSFAGDDRAERHRELEFDESLKLGTDLHLPDMRPKYEH